MLIADFDAVLSDLDGVVYAGDGAIAGAVDSLSRLAEAGVSLAYITNNASRSPETVAEHLRRLGAPAVAGQVFASSDAGADLLAAEVPAGSRVLVVGSDYLRECVASRGLVPVRSSADNPDAVIQGFDPSVGWRDLAEASYAVANGARWFATNDDLTIPRAEGIAPGNGSLVQAVANATGAAPTVAGKPQPLLFRRAADRLESVRPLVVGDRLDTDILGGNRAGFRTAVVFTGIDTTRTVLAARTAERPTFLLADLSELYVPYPAIERGQAGAEGAAGGMDPAAAQGSVTCGGTTARVAGNRILIGGSPNDLNAWRAACGAWWSAHPNVDTATDPDLEFSHG